jgi:hypothetical protein
MRIKFAAESSPRFTNHGCIGDGWGVDLIKMVKEGLKQITHTHSKLLVKSALRKAISTKDPHSFWKEANHIRIAAKRMVSGRYSPTQLLNWREAQSGCLKDSLDHILEILAYKFDHDSYLADYVRGYRFYGMSNEDATLRFEKYHQGLLDIEYVKNVYDGVKYWGNKK